MYNPTLFGNFDVAAFLTTAFTLFFIGLVLYLRREDRREGYPLEDDVTGRLESTGALFFTATPKTFKLPHGEGTKTVPNGVRDTRELKARRTGRAPGSPLAPVGDPLLAGVGPGSYAERAKRPDVLMHGETKVAPLRLCPGFSLDPRDPKPIGKKVVGTDGEVAGVVVDAWIDRSEFLIRYLEIELAGSGKRVLAPMPLVSISRYKWDIKINALKAAQFENVPSLANPDVITFDEEERVAAYYGGGLLYATPERSEPYL
jgi:photosynthetic reaction center H subunit